MPLSSQSEKFWAHLTKSQRTVLITSLGSIVLQSLLWSFFTVPVVSIYEAQRPSARPGRNCNQGLYFALVRKKGRSVFQFLLPWISERKPREKFQLAWEWPALIAQRQSYLQLGSSWVWEQTGLESQREPGLTASVCTMHFQISWEASLVFDFQSRNTSSLLSCDSGFAPLSFLWPYWKHG